MKADLDKKTSMCLIGVLINDFAKFNKNGGNQMKNLIIKLSLITALVITCNTASAVFTDNTSLYVLMHCDATNQGYWLTTPDDNSTGRTANEPILDKSNAANFQFDRTTEPTLMPNSPKGGSYLHFDGINDSVYIAPGWGGGNNVVCDFSLRWTALPQPSDPYTALIQTVPWRCYLTTNRTISFFINNSTWLESSKPLFSNTWYDVHFRLVNNRAILIVGEATNTVNIELSDSSSQIMIGYDIYGLNRFFKGDLDEVRVGYIPEPTFLYCFWIFAFLILNKKIILCTG